MRAELKSFISPDIRDLEKHYPEFGDNFCFYLEISVGLKNEKSSEQFGITVCTPKWLLDNKKGDGIIFDKNYLIVFEYNYQRLYNKIKSYIEMQNGSTWEELALKMGRISYWEFEDYQE
ncbi:MULTISPECIES: Imm8 family immunity protein [Chitinophagaceae]